MNEAPTYCHRCAAPLNPDHVFCGECGALVNPTAAHPAAPAQPVTLNRADARMIAREQKQVEGSYLLGGLLWIGLAIVVAVVLLVIMPDFSAGWALIIGGIVGVFPAFAVVERMIR